MINIEFHCDESGKLGYVDKPEIERGEFTLVAGLIIKPINKEKIKKFCSFIFKKYGDSLMEGKFHITDSREIRENLRRDVFYFLHHERIPLAYGANYAKALNREFEEQKQKIQQSSSFMKKDGIGLSNNMTPFKKNYQAEAFYVFYNKAMIHTLECFNTPISCLVKTDRIDNLLLEKYQDIINQAHSQKTIKPLVANRKDLATGKIETNKISVEVISESPISNLINDSRGEVQIIDSKYSILADVLANSLRKHLENYVRTSDCGPLNNIMAIKDFELSKNFIQKNSPSIDAWMPYPFD